MHFTTASPLPVGAAQLSAANDQYGQIVGGGSGLIGPPPEPPSPTQGPHLLYSFHGYGPALHYLPSGELSQEGLELDNFYESEVSTSFTLFDPNTPAWKFNSPVHPPARSYLSCEVNLQE